MNCDKPKSITFAVYEMNADKSEHNTGRTLTINKDSEYNILFKFNWTHRIKDGVFDDYAILMKLFVDFYGYDVGPSGFSLAWLKGNYGEAVIAWRGPNNPACQIGGTWWKLKRIT